MTVHHLCCFFFSSRRRHTRWNCDWSSDVCSSDLYKVMGLAPYGEPKYAQKIFDHLIDLKKDGSFRLNLDYFNYCTGLTMTNGKFADLFGGPARKAEQRLTQHHMDLAASVQV